MIRSRSSGRILAVAIVATALVGAVPAPAWGAGRAVPTWTPSLELDLGTINGLVFADGSVYAATYNGVFRSSDGRTWNEAGLQGRWIRSVVADTAGSAVYAFESTGYSDGPLWVTADGGASWSMSDPGIPIADMKADPRDPTRMWVATASESALRTSVDGGAHWDRIETGLFEPGISQLAFDAHDGTMYAQGSQYFYAKRAGAAWRRANSPQGGASIVGSGTAGHLYAVADDTFCASTNYAASWSCRRIPRAAGSEVAVLPADGGTPERVLWAAGSFVMASDDGGDGWTTVAGQAGTGPRYTALAADSSAGLVFAGTDESLVRSEDRGATWEASAGGLRAAWIESLAAGADALWAGSGTPMGRLLTSRDAGHSWSLETLPGPPSVIHSIAVDSMTGAVYAAGEYTLFRKGPGAGWMRSALSSNPYAIAVDPTSPRFYLGTSGGVMHSDDGGSSWAPMQLAQAIYALVVDPRLPSRIYAGGDFDTGSSYYYYYPFGGAVFRSEDSGESWTKSQDLQAPVRALAVDPFDAAGLYAGTQYRGVVSSADAGRTWRFPASAPPGDLTALAADPTRNRTVYVSTTQGVYRSRDGGRDWRPLGEGLAQRNVRSLVVSADGRYLLAGTAGSGVVALALEDDPPVTFPCVPGTSRLCFLGNRFQVELTAQRPGVDETESGVAHPLGDRAGYFGIASLTGDATLPEVAVKMLPDGAFGVDGFPFLYSSMTKTSFTLTVTDTLDGTQSYYTGDAARPFCGGSDIAAFASSLSIYSEAGSPAPVPATTGLSLLGGRFTVSLEARARDGRTASGVPFAIGDRFGFFSLPGITGDAGLPELVVKMLDGRGANHAFWVFHGSLTSIAYTLTVHDEQTGETRTYVGGEPFCGSADVRAFVQ